MVINIKIEELIEGLIIWLPIIVTTASMITAATPTPKDDKIIGKIYKVIEALGLVVGKAKDNGK